MSSLLPIIRRFAVCIVLLAGLAASAAPGMAATETESQSDFLRQVSMEWSKLHFSAIKEVLASTPEYNISAFVEGLQNSEDPRVLARILAEMRGNESAHIRTITILKEKLDQDPRLVDRLTKALDEVELEFSKRPRVKPRVGQRLVGGSLMALELYAIMYGSYMLGPAIINQEIVIEHAYIPFISLAGLVVTSFIREVLQLQYTAPAMLREWLVRRRGQNAMRALRLNLSDFKRDGQFASQLARKNYLGNRERRAQAMEASLRLQRQLVAEVDFLSSQGKWGEEVLMQKLALHQRMTKEIYEEFSTEELAWLVESTSKNPKESYSIPLTLKAKILRHIEQVAQELSNLEASLAAKPDYKALLRYDERFGVEKVEGVVQARWSFHLNWAALAVSSSLLGAVYAVGVEPHALDEALSKDLADWLRQNHRNILNTAVVSIVGTWLIQVVDTWIAYKRYGRERSEILQYTRDHILNFHHPKPVGACRSLF